MTRLTTRLVFLGEAFRNIKRTGSMFPSSKTLAKKMVRPIEFSEAKYIVELGAGTGAITKKLLTHMRKDARLLAFESNPKIAATLRALADSRLTVSTEPMERLPGEVDCVISSLPIANLSRPERERLLEMISDSLRPGGCYVQFQYSLASKKHVEARFPDIAVDFTPLNLPPAFVYVCKKDL